MTALVTFLAQTLCTQRSLAKLGLAGTLALLPASVLMLSILGATVTRLWSLVLLRGVGSVVENSMYRSGYELLYTPIAPAKKRSTKTIIDVAFDRIGDVLGGLAVLGLVFLLPALAPKLAVTLAAVAAAAALVVAWRLHGGYVSALAESLLHGVIKLEQRDITDATTKKTLAETTMVIDRARLLAEISKLQGDKAQKDNVAPADIAEARPFRETSDPAVTEALSILRSADSDSIHQLLNHETELKPALVPLIISLLAHDEPHELASGTLQRLAPQIVGQLHDALLDENQPRPIKRRVTAVLRRYPHRRSADALFDGLADERLDIRYRCGQALVAMAIAHPEVVRVDENTIHELVLRELNAPSPIEESAPPDESQNDEPAGWLDQVVRKRLHRKVEHAFSLLSLVYDSNALEHSLLALHSGDTSLHGTALEYLENVLPPKVTGALWRHLRIEQDLGTTRRDRDAVLQELLQSTENLVLDPAALKGPGDS